MPDRTSVKLQYAATPVAKRAQILGPYNTQFKIPANAVGYAETVEFPIDFGATVWGALPHMHTKGVTTRVTRMNSLGSETCLMDIPKWDFHWQQFYFYDLEQGLRVNPGDSLKLTCSWNNPTNSTVHWGEGTSEEMCITAFYVTQ